MVDAGLQPAAVDCDFSNPPTIKASKHLFCLTSVPLSLRASVPRLFRPSVPLLYRDWVYFFSARRKLVILQANKPEIIGVLTSLATGSPRHIRICRRTITSVLLHIHYTYAVRTEKTPPTPVGVNLIFQFRIFNICFIFTSVPLSLRPFGLMV